MEAAGRSTLDDPYQPPVTCTTMAALLNQRAIWGHQVESLEQHLDEARKAYALLARTGRHRRATWYKTHFTQGLGDLRAVLKEERRELLRRFGEIRMMLNMIKIPFDWPESERVNLRTFGEGRVLD